MIDECPDFCFIRYSPFPSMRQWFLRILSAITVAGAVGGLHPFPHYLLYLISGSVSQITWHFNWLL